MFARRLSLVTRHCNPMSDQPIILPGSGPKVSFYMPRFRPVATYVILGLNFLIFALMTFAGGSRNPDVLLNFGASYGPHFRHGEYWRLVMPMFLHIGVFHLLVNSYALYLLGCVLEQVYGYGRFTLLYVGSGITSSFLSMTVSPHVAAGASGAIFGIAGVMLVSGYLHRSTIPRRLRRVFGSGILLMIVANLLFGFMVPGIDNWGHLGGLAGGILLALAIPPPQQDYVPVAEMPSQAIVIVPVAVVALAMAVTVDHYRASRVVTQLLQEGEHLRAAQQTDGALQRFQEAQRRAPRDERPHEELGSLYLEQRRVADAVQEYEEALRLSPDSVEARLGLALAYEEKGDLAHAQEYLKAVQKDYPRSPELQYTQAFYYAEQKFYAEAIQHYQEALRLKPDMAAAHNNLAWLYATSEDPQFRNPHGALEHARRAVELTGWKQAEFIDTLAEALYANGDFDEAVKTQTKALKLSPDNRELQEHMARYRKAAGV